MHKTDMLGFSVIRIYNNLGMPMWNYGLLHLFMQVSLY